MATATLGEAALSQVNVSGGITPMTGVAASASSGPAVAGN
jgi:hypothetical protein